MTAINSEYLEQNRGSLSAYRRYLDGMDASMKQKIALAAAHLHCTGRVADMGMGSGTGSDALAALYPLLSVFGVDVNPSMVSLAKERYQRPNLEFIQGDISESVFQAESISAIINSSVFHHVTSFNGYRREEVMRALKSQCGQLAQNGVILIRDFLAPKPATVWLDLPSHDGDNSHNPQTCSSANLFRLFSTQFRSLSESPGFKLETVSDADIPDGFERFVCSSHIAAEFLLRKDYRDDWETEIKEEYTYFTQQQFEDAFVTLGLRVLASIPIHNSWIVRHRFLGKAHLHNTTGAPHPFPPTNYIISGEKVTENQGVRFSYEKACEPTGFLEMMQYAHKETGQIRDLIRRPHPTIDIIPWFEADGDIFILARKSYPRPLLQACPETSEHIDGSSPVGYVTEPLNLIQTKYPIGSSVEQALVDRAGISPDQLTCFEEGTIYYPSPGGIMEEIRSVFVQIPPIYASMPLEGLSGFSTSGRIEAMEARQLLRAAQVGGLPDARLELNVYHLLQKHHLSPGPWIGETIRISEGPKPSDISNFQLTSGRRRFSQIAPQNAQFLKLAGGSFSETNAAKEPLFIKSLEYVVPAHLSTNTIATALIRKHNGTHYMGVFDDDLPAAQGFTGNSNLFVTPAWRLPRTIGDMTSAANWTTERIQTDHGLTIGNVYTLGGNYFPSSGVTPENVTPLCFEILDEQPSNEPLTWIPVLHLIENAVYIRDGHLRITTNRIAHALYNK